MSLTKPMRVALLYAEVGVVDLERKDYVYYVMNQDLSKITPSSRVS